nr:shikimate kinase [Staphylococcus canis]
MIKSNLPIILIGFMGSGKTTIGQEFAQLNDLTFVDLDRYIVETMNLSIPEIFERYGEKEFRKIELKSLKEVIKKYDIIATGGGIVESERSLNYLNSINHPIIWIDAPFDTLYTRIKNDKNRPNAFGQNYNTVKNLYFKRYSRYNEIAFIKLSSNIPFDRTLNELNQFINADDQY